MFGNIDRDKLWEILHRKGKPNGVMRSLTKGRSKNYARGGFSGCKCAGFEYNVGLWRGRAICALLFIIYSCGVTDNYNRELLAIILPHIG